MSANLRAPCLLAQKVAPGMERLGWGRIVNLGATSGFVRTHSVYGLAKAALLHLTESLALEFAPAITVNAVVPSQIASARTDTMPAYKTAAIDGTPLGRLVTEEEIGRMVALLCSADFDFVTGRSIVIDGGRLLPAFRLNIEAAKGGPGYSLLRRPERSRGTSSSSASRLKRSLHFASLRSGRTGGCGETACWMRRSSRPTERAVSTIAAQVSSGSGTPSASRLMARARLRLAGHQDLAARRRRPRALHEVDVLGDVLREEALRIEHLGIDVERQHAVGEAAALGIGRAVARRASRPASRT